MKDLKPVGNPHPVQEPTHARGTLSSCALIVLGIEGSDVRHGSVVFSMVMQSAERARKRARQPFAELRTHCDGAQGLGPEARKLKFYGLVQRNAEHVIQGLEMALVLIKHLCFFIRQARSPILLDGPAAG